MCTAERDRPVAQYLFFFVSAVLYMHVNWKANKRGEHIFNEIAMGIASSKREANTLINELFPIISTWPDDYHRSGRHIRLPYYEPCITFFAAAAAAAAARIIRVFSLFVQSKEMSMFDVTNKSRKKTMATVMTSVYLFAIARSERKTTIENETKRVRIEE